MVDPRIPNQDLWFAITKSPRGQVLFFDYLTSKSLDFSDPLNKFFERPGDKPDPIWQGDSLLTTWIDITARSNYIDTKSPYKKAMQSPFEGTLFAHGMFFAHEDEDVMPFFGVPGAYKPQFIPPQPKRQWRRP